MLLTKVVKLNVELRLKKIVCQRLENSGIEVRKTITCRQCKSAWEDVQLTCAFVFSHIQKVFFSHDATQNYNRPLRLPHS